MTVAVLLDVLCIEAVNILNIVLPLRGFSLVDGKLSQASR